MTVENISRNTVKDDIINKTQNIYYRSVNSGLMKPMNSEWMYYETLLMQYTEIGFKCKNWKFLGSMLPNLKGH